MPRTAEQNQALRDASRERLLAAAMRRFSRDGYSATSIRGIAQEAGVAQGLLYSHFPGKEELLRALFRRSMDDVRESFAAAAAQGPSGPPVGSPLERLVTVSVAILRRNLEFWRLCYGVRMQPGVVEALGPDLQAWTGEILATLGIHFRAAGSRRPDLEAALFFAAFDGMCQHFVLAPHRYPLEELSALLLARFTPAARPGRAGKSSAPKPKGASHEPNRRPRSRGRKPRRPR